MTVKPQIRLLFFALIMLIQFFLVITYTNALAGKNVQLTRLQSSISKENLSQGEYRETISQQLNEKIISDQRNESISRVSPDETIKLRDLQPGSAPTQTTPTQQPASAPTQSIVAF